jgi:hypothetical protein
MKVLKHWRTLCRGDAREIQEPLYTLTMHSDAADLGCGETLGVRSGLGQPGDADGQDLWEASDCRDRISVRELRAVRLLMSRHFAEELSHPLTRRLILWEDNQAVVAAIKKMTCRSVAMMSELRKLKRTMDHLEIHIGVCWLPSAVNKFADRLSRTWGVTDMRVEESLLESMVKAYGFQKETQMLTHHPMGDHPVAVRKQC